MLDLPTLSRIAFPTNRLALRILVGGRVGADLREFDKTLETHYQYNEPKPKACARVTYLCVCMVFVRERRCLFDGGRVLNQSVDNTVSKSVHVKNQNQNQHNVRTWCYLDASPPRFRFLDITGEDIFLRSLIAIILINSQFLFNTKVLNTHTQRLQEETDAHNTHKKKQEKKVKRRKIRETH